jgi:uncharacterized YigZ family protein
MDIKDTYKTIEKPSKGEYKDKGSKFIAYAFEINSEQEFKIHLDEIKKEHFKARHHCYAYAIGPNHEKYRYNDDGEPGGTAGLPIYNQIKSKNLSNIAIIVVRYFGGTKLGVPGLINAYKESTKDALKNGIIIDRYIEDTISIKYDFKYTGEIMKVINSTDAIISENNFEIIPELVIRIRKSKTADFIKNVYSAILKRDISDITTDEKIEGLKVELQN